jgi:Rieske Fe-S protein
MNMMDRREFTRTCIMCLTGASLVPVVSGCQSTYYTNGTLESNGISVSRSEFTYVKKDQPLQREYIIVRNNAMEFPIYLYRFSDDEYSAMLMKCTHQGNELQASGDHLHCSAHGSEFNNRGTVEQGPAEKNLRTFSVTTQGDKIFIDLTA